MYILDNIQFTSPSIRGMGTSSLAPKLKAVEIDSIVAHLAQFSTAPVSSVVSKRLHLVRRSARYVYPCVSPRFRAADAARNRGAGIS